MPVLKYAERSLLRPRAERSASEPEQAAQPDPSHGLGAPYAVNRVSQTSGRNAAKKVFLKNQVRHRGKSCRMLCDGYERRCSKPREE
jgi:hypothetical protein